MFKMKQFGSTIRTCVIVGLTAGLLAGGLSPNTVRADEDTMEQKLEELERQEQQQQQQQQQQKQSQASSRTYGAPPPALKGPKRTVSVGQFTAVGSFTQKYGNWDIGDGLGAMLTTALVNSGQFVVIERARIDKVMSEQELKASGLVRGPSGPQLGKLSGVQLLIVGTVTEFGTADKGGGMNLGLAQNLGSLPFNLGGATESASGKVAMDVRVIDTSTGEVIESHNVSHEVEDSAFSMETSFSGISLGGDQFEKTPLGEATRGAIQKAVHAIVGTAARRPWSGLVVAIDGGDVIINAGQRAGMKPGDMFMIEGKGKVFTDPSTGQVLGSRRTEIGMLRLNNVQEKLSFGTFSPLGTQQPKRGDSVVIMNR